MFTGIVQGTATVTSVDARQNISTVTVDFPDGAVEDVKVGASIAINGTCLTVTTHEGRTVSFDIIGETLRATNLGELQEGSTVNFERSARVGDEIGGHNVSGHVHTTASIVAVKQDGENRRLQFQLTDCKWMKYVLPKGYIAVDGCSLTIGEVTSDGFSVYLIPETLRATVLGSKREGGTVNVEIESQTQAIVDTVERVVKRYMDDKGISDR